MTKRFILGLVELTRYPSTDKSGMDRLKNNSNNPNQWVKPTSAISKRQWLFYEDYIQF